MNTYLYAPKDDYKHRLDWRELYTEEQAGMCRRVQLVFVILYCTANCSVIDLSAAILHQVVDD